MRLSILLFTLIPYLSVHSQNKINSDRPDQTEGTHAIQPRELQIEADFYYNYFEKEKSALISSSLIRLGLMEKAEFRLVVEEGRQRDAFIETTQGVYPLSAGTKVELIKEHAWIPNISGLAYLQLPFTSKSEENKLRWSPAFVLATEYDVDKLSIDVNVGVKWGAFEPAKALMASSSFRYEWSEKLQSFIEYYAQFSLQSHPMHNSDLGVMYLFSDQFQMSLSFGTSLYAEEYNGFAMVGTALRLPH